MSDLFETLQEAQDERIAIKVDAGITEASAIEQTRKEMHSCEVISVVRRYYPDGKSAAEYFEQVEKKRGHLAAQKLRDDVRAEWKKRQAEDRQK